MRDHLRRLQEMGSELLSLFGLGKSATADDRVAIPIDVARQQRETATASDAELIEFLDRCAEASEIQGLHYATGEAVARLVAGDFESRTAGIIAQQAVVLAAPVVSDSAPATVSNLRELRPRMANPFDTVDTLLAEAMKKVEEGRRESEARIKAITQRASELSANVESVRGELTSRDSRISELERKLIDGELAKQKVGNQLEQATKQVERLILHASAHEAARKSQVRWLLISLGIAGAIVIALLFVLARANS
jgi:hypothetical protein